MIAQSNNLRIANIVVSGDFNQPVLFSKLLKKEEMFSYDPEQYHGAYIQLHNTKATIYTSGKYIIPGLKSIKDIDYEWNYLVDILSKYIDSTKFKAPVIKNIVAVYQFKNQINLKYIYENYIFEDMKYNPSIFPGITIKTKYATARIFSSGKMIIVGAKSLNDVSTTFKSVYQKIIDIGYP